MVKVYSSDNCRYCRDLKAYLEKKNIPYETFDVARNESYAREMQSVSGQSAIPVTVIGDEIIIGFDIAKIDKALSNIN
ncbi:MAG: glutaredoxin family protein [Oscillospiraceae bacterium]|nr:glutaredoxin family protein [Oscillospiraceae bacterium]